MKLKALVVFVQFLCLQSAFAGKPSALTIEDDQPEKPQRTASSQSEMSEQKSPTGEEENPHWEVQQRRTASSQSEMSEQKSPTSEEGNPRQVAQPRRTASLQSEMSEQKSSENEEAHPTQIADTGRASSGESKDGGRTEELSPTHQSALQAVEVVGDFLEALMHKNFPNQRKVAKMNISSYVERLHKWSTIWIGFDPPTSFSILISGLVYLDRFIKHNPTWPQSLTFHRLWLQAYMLGIKMYCDDLFNNKSMAYLGGIPLKEYNYWEAEFLFAIKWEGFIAENDFKLYLDAFKKEYLELGPIIKKVEEELSASPRAGVCGVRS